MNGVVTGTSGNVISGQIRRVRRGQRKAFVNEPPPAPPEPVRQPARVAIMLALAHKIQRAIDQGIVRDRAEVARRLGLTRARVTQITDLTLIAPDIQERVLELEAIDGQEPLTARALREVVCHERWEDQRRAWASVPGLR